MGDDSGLPLEPLEPLIDVRSPGERMADSGRAGLERLKARVEEQRLDIAAVIWMVLLLAMVGANIYSALRFGNIQGFPGVDDWWYRLQVLSQSGGVLLVFGGAIGIALAVLLEGPTSRLALRLAALGGAWTIVASCFGVAVAFHTEEGDFSPHRAFDGRLTQSVYYLGYAGLGLLVALIGWRFSRQGDEA